MNTWSQAAEQISQDEPDNTVSSAKGAWDDWGPVVEFEKFKKCDVFLGNL